MFVISVISDGSGGMGELVSLWFFCLNPDLERFSSTISRFKCGFWC